MGVSQPSSRARVSASGKKTSRSRADAARARNKRPCLGCKQRKQKCSGGSRCTMCMKRNISCEPAGGVVNTRPVFIFESGIKRPRSNTVQSATTIAGPVSEVDEGEDQIVSPVLPTSQPHSPTTTDALSPTTELSFALASLAVGQPGPSVDSRTPPSTHNNAHQQPERTLTEETGSGHFNLDGHASSSIDDTTQYGRFSQPIASESLSRSIPDGCWDSNRAVLGPSATYPSTFCASIAPTLQGQQGQAFTGGNQCFPPLLAGFYGYRSLPPGPSASPMYNNTRQQPEHTLTEETGRGHFNLDDRVSSPIDDTTQYGGVLQPIASENLSISIPDGRWDSSRAVLGPSAAYASTFCASNAPIPQGQQGQAFTGGNLDFSGSVTGLDRLHGSLPLGPSESSSGFSHPAASNELQPMVEQLNGLNAVDLESLHGYYDWFLNFLQFCSLHSPFRNIAHTRFEND